MENNENIKIDELLDELTHLKERNEFLERCVEGLRIHNSELTLERNKLCDKVILQSKELRDIKKMSMFEFANTFCTEESLEEAGHQLARSLGVGGA